MQRSKEGTARIALYKELSIPNIFTVECSFCGPSFKDIHFSTKDLKELGHRICQAIYIKWNVAKVVIVKEMDSTSSKSSGDTQATKSK